MNKLYNTSKFKCILFDMDGVVIDTEHLYINAESNFFDSFNIPPSSIDWTKLHGCSEKDFYRYCTETLKIQESPDRLKEKCHSMIKKEFDSGLKFNKDFYEFYESIPSNITKGIVTSTSRGLFKFIDQKIQISRLFDTIICGDDLPNSKPSPEPYERAMQLLSAKPIETLIIEDSLVGLQAARASGAHVVALVGTYQARELEAADTIIERFCDIDIKRL